VLGERYAHPGKPQELAVGRSSARNASMAARISGTAAGNGTVARAANACRKASASEDRSGEDRSGEDRSGEATWPSPLGQVGDGRPGHHPFRAERPLEGHHQCIASKVRRPRGEGVGRGCTDRRNGCHRADLAAETLGRRPDHQAPAAADLVDGGHVQPVQQGKRLHRAAGGHRRLGGGESSFGAAWAVGGQFDRPDQQGGPRRVPAALARPFGCPLQDVGHVLVGANAARGEMPGPPVGVGGASGHRGQRRVHPAALARGRAAIDRRTDQRVPKGDPFAGPDKISCLGEITGVHVDSEHGRARGNVGRVAAGFGGGQQQPRLHVRR